MVAKAAADSSVHSSKSAPQIALGVGMGLKKPPPEL